MNSGEQYKDQKSLNRITIPNQGPLFPIKINIITQVSKETVCENCEKLHEVPVFYVKVSKRDLPKLSTLLL